MPVLGRTRPVRPQILRGWVEFPTAGIDAPAGGPTGAGESSGTLAHVQALAACPTATGDATGTTATTGVDVYPKTVVVVTAPAASSAEIRYRRQTVSAIDLGAPLAEPETQAPAGGPTAAGASSGTTVQIGTFTNAPAGLAAGTGTAEQPEATVAPNAGTPTATGDSSGTTVQTSSAEVFPPRTFVATETAHKSRQLYRRQATAQFVDLGAPPVQQDTNAPAACPTAAGTAFTAIADIDVKPAGPTAAGAASGQTALTGAVAGGPTAAGNAPQPEAEIGTKPNTPVAAGASSGTTVQTGTFANAPAGCPTAAGTAFTASVTIRPNAAVGLAAGLTTGSVALVAAKAGGPTGAGTAGQATVLFGTQALAGLASAIGVANTPKIDLDINAGVPVAAGQAFPVFGLVGNPMGPGEGVIVTDDPVRVTVSDPAGVIVTDDVNAVEVVR